MNTIQKSALLLTILGAINWGIIGIFKTNLIAKMFGEFSLVTRIIYIIIFVAAIVNIGLFFVDVDNKRYSRN